MSTISKIIVDGMTSMILDEMTSTIFRRNNIDDLRRDDDDVDMSSNFDDWASPNVIVVKKRIQRRLMISH